MSKELSIEWKDEGMKKILLLLLVGLILGSMCIPRVFADDKREPKGKVETNRIVMSTGILTAVFEGKKPKLTFYPANTTNEYKLTFKRLIEFNDTNRDETYQKDERVAWTELESAAWTHTAFYNLTGRQRARIGIGINFTYSGQLRIESKGAQPKTVANATIKFAVKLFQYNLTDIKLIGYQGFTYSALGGAEVKVDVILSGWPFGTEKTPKLALEIQLHSDNNQFEVEEKGGRKPVNVNQTVAEERKMDQTNDVEQKIRYLNATGKVAGFFKFVRFAIVRFAGELSVVNVYASYTGEQEEGKKEFKIFLAYPKFAGTLEHDPSFGVGDPVILTPWQVEDTIPEFPISATIVLLMTISAVALILHILKPNRGESIKSLRTVQS